MTILIIILVLIALITAFIAGLLVGMTTGIEMENEYVHNELFKYGRIPKRLYYCGLNDALKLCLLSFKNEIDDVVNWIG